MRTIEEWYSLLAINPEDWATRLVFADWAEENDLPRIANGQRWQVGKRKISCFSWLPFMGYIHFWYPQSYRGWPVPNENRLANDIFDKLELPIHKENMSWRLNPKGAATMMAAENALAITLSRLNIVVTYVSNTSL